VRRQDVRKVLILFLFFLAPKTLGVKDSNNQAQVKGLSASSTADNIALLMTAYSSTPNYGSLFEADMNQFEKVVTDPSGNYRFKTMIDHRVSHEQMLVDIRSAASQVSADGTLLLFIAAHGSQDGRIQPEDQRYTTLGYSEILTAIRDGRKGKPFRRFVLFVSACYSGSWFQTLQSSDGLFEERLVISSVGPNQLSWIAQATRGMLQAFNQLKDNKDSTLQDLINQTKANVGDIQFAAIPASMMSESLVNPPSDPSRPGETATSNIGNSESNGNKPSTGGSDSSNSNPKPADDPSNIGRVFAITRYDARGGVQLYVYSEKKVNKIEMKTGQGWWILSDEYIAQPNLQSIYGTWANRSWANESTVGVRLTMPDASLVEIEADIEHR